MFDNPMFAPMRRMFDDFIDKARWQLTDALMDTLRMDEPDAMKAAETAGRSFAGLVKERMAAKDYTVLDELLSGETTLPDNPALQSLVQPLTDAVAAGTSLDNTMSRNVAITLLPEMFNMFNDQAKAAAEQGIDLKDLVRRFSGGGMPGLGALAGLNMSNVGALMEIAGSFGKDRDGKNDPAHNN